MNDQPPAEGPSQGTSPDRLDSWKEIANYLRRDVRTLQRWEKVDGIPIHRVFHGERAPVFAYRTELDAWLKSKDNAGNETGNVDTEKTGRAATEINGATESGEEPSPNSALKPSNAKTDFPSRAWTTAEKSWFAAALVVLVVVSFATWPRSAAKSADLPSAAQFASGCEPPSGLLAGWRAQGNTEDILRRNNAAILGGAGFAPGIQGQAFSLNGVNAEVLTPLRRLPREFTASVWIHLETLTHPPGQNMANAPAGDMSILDKMASEPGPNIVGWRLLKQHDNLLMFCIGGGYSNGCGGPARTVFSRNQVAAHAWYHVAVVKDSDTFSLYVNGRLEDTRALPPSDQSVESDVPLRIGASEREGAHFNGLIDEVLVFSRPLSVSEIKKIYEAGASGACGARAAVDATAAGH